MELTCKQCNARFRAAIQLPLTAAVRVACPNCGNTMVLKPPPNVAPPNVAPPPSAARPAVPRKRLAAIADEPRPFRSFLAEHLRRLGFEVTMFEGGEAALEFVRRNRAELAIVNVYLKGKLG